MALLKLGKAAQDVADSVEKLASATETGFTDLMKNGSAQSSANVVNFKTARSNVGGQKSATPASTKTAPASAMSSDIAAATELSMEELSKQTDVLRDIEKNTKQTTKNTAKPPSAGGQAPAPPSEDVIKAQAKAGTDDGDNSKLEKYLDKVQQAMVSGMGTGLLALGAALFAMRDKEAKQAKVTDEVVGQNSKALAAIGGIQGNELFKTQGSDASLGRDATANEATIAANKENLTKVQALAIDQMRDEGKSEGEISKEVKNIEEAFNSGDLARVYKKIGQYTTGKDPIVYQTKIDTNRLSMGDAEKLGAAYGIQKKDNESDEAYKKRLLESTSIESDFARSKADAYMGGTAARNIVRGRLEDNLIRSAGLDTSNMSFFDPEYFPKNREADQMGDRLEAQIDSVVGKLSDMGKSDAEINRMLAAEATKIKDMKADELATYDLEKSVMTGDMVGAAQDQSNAAAREEADRRAVTPATPAPASTSAEPREKDVITTGLSLDTKAHDDTAKELRKLSGFFAGGF